MNFDPQNFGEFLDAYQHYISDRRQYQEGGDTQGGGSQQVFMQQAVQAIASGQADAHDVFVQLQEMGMKQEQAATVVEQIMTAASQLKSQPQEPEMTGVAAYGGQLREYESDVNTGNVITGNDGSKITDPYSGVADSVRTDHNMMSNVEDTPLNQTFAGLNALGNPKSMAWMLKDTGAQGFIKKFAGLGAIAGGIGLGFQKFASPDKVTHTSAAPKGTMLATDKTGQQTSISPEEAAKRQTSQVTTQIPSQNKIGQPATIASFGQQNDPTAWQKQAAVPQIPGMPVFTQPKQFGYGAEVDFNDMFLPQHQSNVGTGNVGPVQPFTFAGIPGNVTTIDNPVKTDNTKVSGIPYNNAGPMAEGMNTGYPVEPAANPMLDYFNKSMGDRTLNLEQDNSAKGVVKDPPKTETVTTKTRGDAGGMNAMFNTLNGLDLLNSTIGAKDAEREYQQRVRDARHSDSLASTNAYNPYGFHTVNDQVVQGRTANMGSIQDIGTYMATAANGGNISIDPSKKGTFKAQATRMDMSIQEAASHILANKEQYSPEMVKKANFAKNFAKEHGGEIHDFGAYLPHYAQGSDAEFAEGGEYELTEAQIRHILANGGEIEFL